MRYVGLRASTVARRALAEVLLFMASVDRGIL